jgi:hypothetical protein
MAIKNSLLEELFTPVNYKLIKSGSPFKAGNLITFNYTFWKKDPYPLVIISPPRSNSEMIVRGKGMLWGVNLHYLTFHDIKILIQNAKNPVFSYANYIKNNKNIKDAYRSYKWSGVRQEKSLNTDFLLKVSNFVRNIDPAETEIIRKNVREQISKQINPKPYEVNVKTLNTQEAPQLGAVPVVKTVPIVQNQTE